MTSFDQFVDGVADMPKLSEASHGRLERIREPLARLRGIADKSPSPS